MAQAADDDIEMHTRTHTQGRRKGRETRTQLQSIAHNEPIERRNRSPQHIQTQPLLPTNRLRPLTLTLTRRATAAPSPPPKPSRPTTASSERWPAGSGSAASIQSHRQSQRQQCSRSLSFIPQSFQPINPLRVLRFSFSDRRCGMDRRFATATTHRLPAAAAPASRSRRTPPPLPA